MTPKNVLPTWPSPCETQDKRPLGRESDRSLCHHHIMSTIMFFWSQPMTPGAPYRQGEKFLAWPTTDVKLETSSRWVGTRTGGGVIATLM